MNVLKNTRTLFYAAGLLVSSLLAACGGGSDQGRDPILGLPAASLVSVSVTPATATVLIGATQQYNATASYSDGSSANVTTTSTWSSASPTIATVGASSGLATGVSAGSAALSATFGGKSGSANLVVTAPIPPPAPTLTGITVTPATATIVAGTTQQYVATGTYSNLSTAVLTGVTWTSSAPAFATIAASGMATGLSAGNTTIRATLGTITGTAALTVTAAPLPPAPVLTSIAVTPATATIVAGTTQQYVATGTYSNQTTAVLSTGITWTSSCTACATINASGLATGVAAGSSNISATNGTLTGTAVLTVTAAPVLPPAVTLTSIALTPANASILVGATQQYAVTGTYSNQTTAVITTGITYSSNTQSVATITASGNATGITAGTSNIRADVGNLNATAVLTVTAPPPQVQTINLGGAARFAVLAGTSITNNSGGTTLVTGDVGAPSQTVDPTQAAGFTNFKSGAILAQGLADLQVAVTDANSRTCTVSSAAGVDLGGLVLTPGVYCYAGAISITGTFTMNGPGLYIFRTASTLNTTANSIVAFTGGATAGSVFWVPVGPTTLGANSVFKGTILGSSAAITIGDNTTLLEGRVLTQAAVTLRNNQITKP
ncbi:MAG: Ig-like domain-containing protein [Pseudomonadota bacterium]